MSKKHWLSKILEPACFFSEGDDEERFNVKAERLVLDTIKSKLPEEKKDTSAQDLRAGTFTRGQDQYIIGWNECLKAVKEALEIE